MTEQQRREYDAQRQAEYRERKRNQRETGSVIPNETLTREVLADLAIMILASGAPGNDTLVAGLTAYFKDRAGFPSHIVHKCRAGKLRPKIVGTF
ncbi:MAG: hypothetical protein KL863_05250 [Rhizobium sp.]|nr:hypothetical protein [Rhizobium sp.]